MENLPFYEAICNAVALFFMLLGFYFIKSGKKEQHIKCMLTALFFSALFLGLYLTYHFSGVPTKKYTGDLSTFYYGILITHIILAAVSPFLVGFVTFKGLKGELASHKKFARFTLPIWVYVSATGIAIYFMVHAGT